MEELGQMGPLYQDLRRRQEDAQAEYAKICRAWRQTLSRPHDAVRGVQCAGLQKSRYQNQGSEGHDNDNDNDNNTDNDNDNHHDHNVEHQDL